MFAQRFDPNKQVQSSPRLLKRRRNTESDDEDASEIESSLEKESLNQSSTDSSSEEDSSDEMSSDQETTDLHHTNADCEIGDPSNASVTNMDVEEPKTQSFKGQDADIGAVNRQVVDEDIDAGAAAAAAGHNNEDDDGYMQDKHMAVATDGNEDGIKDNSDYKSKHTSIFKRLDGVNRKNEIQKAQKAQNDGESQIEDEEMQDQAAIEKQNLAPFPQPALPRDRKLKTIQSNSLDWLADPIYSSPDITSSFEEFNLSPFLVKNLKAGGFAQAFSVQVSILKLMAQDKLEYNNHPDSPGDILVNASTGSGKTLGYVVPIVEKLSTRIVPRVRAIFLVPTKPLISQVKETFRQLSRGTSLSVVSLKNEISIKTEGEKLNNNEPDIIIATPGRLVDHLNNGTISLSALEFLVVDEADRLLNQSFQDWASTITSKLPEIPSMAQVWYKRVQKWIFSATLTTDAGKLSLLDLYNPRLIVVNDQRQLVNEAFSLPAKLLEHKILFGSAKTSLKPLIMFKFLVANQLLQNVLIFVKSNEASLRLSALLDLLAKAYMLPLNVTYLNSTNNTSQNRSKILSSFEQGSINVLVGTDLIARGLDIPTISTVVNYDLPNSSREYVHRVGRTARANQSGSVYTLCFGKGEDKWFKKLVSGVSRSQEMENMDPSTITIEDEDENKYEACLGKLSQIVKER